jgi:hypothetical protein
VFVRETSQDAAVFFPLVCVEDLEGELFVNLIPGRRPYTEDHQTSKHKVVFLSIYKEIDSRGMGSTIGITS